MKRGGPLSRHTRLERTARIRPVNRERRARAYARNFGERAEHVRAMRCLVADRMGHLCRTRIVAAHVIARGMGGAKGDRRDLIPLCWESHEWAGERGTDARARFEQFYGIDLQAEAARIASELDARGLP